jgi:hypothetical protein
LLAHGCLATTGLTVSMTIGATVTTGLINQPTLILRPMRLFSP